MNEQTEMIPSNEAEADHLIDSALDQVPDSNDIKEQTSQPVDEFTFTVGGKEIKANKDKLIRWAQQGYDAPTKIGSITKELQGWQKKYNDEQNRWKEIEGKYSDVDKYVRDNPKFWDHVLDSYQKKEQLFSNQDDPIAQTVSQLQSRLEGLEKYKNEIETRNQEAQLKHEDSALEKEIEGIRTAYPSVDFTTPDDQGKSLEMKVLNYANENGIKKFTTAFRDFYHDELLKLSTTQGKEQAVKEKVKNTKLGILGVSTQPTKKINTDVKGKSWNELSEEVMQELGIR